MRNSSQPFSFKKNMAEEISFNLTYIVYAEPEKVFEALTNEAIIEKWSEAKACVEPKPGGRFEMFDGWVNGEVANYNPPFTFSHTWKPAEWKPKTKASVVVFNLEKHKAGTLVNLVHSGFPDQQQADSHKEGWINFVLDPINDFFV